MALTYMEGFDLDTLMDGWSAFSDQGFEAGTWGGRQFWAGNSSAGVARYMEFDWLTAGQSALSAGYVGWRGRYTGVPTNGQFAQLQENGITTHLALRRNAGGQIELVRGDATVLGTTISAVDITISHHYSVDFVIGDGTAGSATVKIDGAAVITVSGVDTRNSASGTGVVNKMHWTTAGTGNVFVRIDDYYHGNATGVAPYNAAPGECRVETLRPTGDGASSQWVNSAATSVANWSYIDDNTTTADYIGSGTTGNRDLHTLGDLYVPGAGVVQVYAVQEAVLAAKSDSGTAKDLLGVLRDADGTVVTETLADDLALTTTYTWFKGAVKTLDPDGVAWTSTSANALQAGVEVGS